MIQDPIHYLFNVQHDIPAKVHKTGLYLYE